MYYSTLVVWRVRQTCFAELEKLSLKVEKTFEIDKESKMQIILKAQEMIKKQKVGQYIENIFEICSNEHGWGREDTLTAINSAK